MSAKTKILVVKMREIIYTVIFLVLIILLAVLLFFMFRSRDRETQISASQIAQESALSPEDTAQYIAGVYTTPVTLGDSTVDVEVTVDENHINAIHLVNLSEATTAMYPLVSPSLESIAAQICQTQSLENITCPESYKYTAQMLLNAVSQALENAKRENWE